MTRKTMWFPEKLATQITAALCINRLKLVEIIKNEIQQVQLTGFCPV